MAQPDAAQMRQLVKKGQAMPPGSGGGRPGRFQVRNRADLDNAIKAVGRVRPNTEEARSKVRRFLIRRAKALNATDMIPDTWKADGTLTT